MDHDDKIIATVIALDVAFGALLRNVRDQLPGLAMLLREELESGSKSRAPGLPEGVTQHLAQYAEMLAKRPTPSGRR